MQRWKVGVRGWRKKESLGLYEYQEMWTTTVEAQTQEDALKIAEHEFYKNFERGPCSRFVSRSF